jgi:hypothetical protein
VTSRASRGLAGRRGGLAFALYLLLAFAYLGVPVLAHPERRVVGGLFTDPQIFIWSFAWWPHAILHGQNPFFTHAIWEPDGFNLAWATSVPGLAIVFAPLTLLFGPVLAYNVASILTPALSAWTAFLLCRRLTGKDWPSLAGGYLFGFSTYVLSAELTHIFDAAVFLVPVVGLLVVRFVERDLSPRGLALRLGLVLAAQMLLSTEVLFTLTLAVVVGLAVGLVVSATGRAAVRRLVVPLVGAYAFAAVLTAPFLYYIFTGVGSRPDSGADAFSADLLNVVVPTKATVGGWWTGHFAEGFPANDAERGTYLGLPVLVIVALFAWRRWRTPFGRFLLAGFVLSVIGALGSWLTIDGHQRLGIAMPWAHLAARPLFENVMPVRLMLYATLAAAVMIALWAASSARPAWLRIVLPVLAAIAILPNLSWHVWARSPQVPGLFETSLYKSCIGRGENVLLLPFGSLGDSMAWQARANFWFEDAGAYITPFAPQGYLTLVGTYKISTENSPPNVGTQDVLELVRLKHVTTIVVDARDAGPWVPVLRPFARPQAVGGALIYRLRDAPPLRQTCAAAASRA